MFHQKLVSHPRAAICLHTGDECHSLLVTGRRLHVASRAKMKVKTVIILQPVFNVLFTQSSVMSSGVPCCYGALC